MNMTTLPHKTLERKYLAKGYECVVGIDEVGMGCLAGPVVVCAILITTPFYNQRHPELAEVRDSKLTTQIMRERIAKALRATANISFSIISIPPRDVDAYNVLQAARRGMRIAVTRLIKKEKFSNPAILVDGNRSIPDIAWFQKTIIKGDRKVFAIACASILAKVYRDASMRRAARRYPGYGLEIHKGYGTKYHYERLRVLGPSPLHRRSFRLK